MEEKHDISKSELLDTTEKLSTENMMLRSVLAQIYDSYEIEQSTKGGDYYRLKLIAAQKHDELHAKARLALIGSNKYEEFNTIH